MTPSYNVPLFLFFLCLSCLQKVNGERTRRNDPMIEGGDDNIVQIKIKKNSIRFRVESNSMTSTDRERVAHRAGSIDSKDFEMINEGTKEVDMNLFSGRDLKFVHMESSWEEDLTGGTNFYFSGESTIGTKLATLSLTRRVFQDGKQVIAGNVQDGEVIYQIRQVTGDSASVEEFSQLDFDDELEVEEDEVSSEYGNSTDFSYALGLVDQVDLPIQSLEPSKRFLSSDDGSELDVLVLYTKGAMCSAAGYGRGGRCEATWDNSLSIETIIRLAIVEGNQAMSNSGIPARFRLVKSHLDLEYDDYSDSWVETLSTLRRTRDGKLDYVHSMRTRYGADFVVMLVDKSRYCGMGYRPSSPQADYAFSLIQWSCATGYYSFIHEIGHNMGCRHDKDNASGGNLDSSHNYGYQEPSGKFRTIMSYNCRKGCPRLLRFSNPNESLGKLPSGDALADNAKWIRERLPAYANFRSSQYLPVDHSPVASPNNPSPTPPSDLNQELITSMAGGFAGAPGNMFDIVAKTNISIKNFAVHSTAATTVVIEVWKMRRAGSFVEFQDANDWEKIGTVHVESSPAGNPTILPLGFMKPVSVKVGETQGFYVTFSASTNYNRYTKGTALGNVFTENEDIAFLEGVANEYRFSRSDAPRIFNGIVYYEKDIETPESSFHPSTPSGAPSSLPSIIHPVPIAKTIETAFHGSNGSYGCMFDVRAKTDILIQNMAIHTYHTTWIDVEVYKLQKADVSHAECSDLPSLWEKVASVRVLGEGKGRPTSLADLEEMHVRKGSLQAIYVTIIGGGLRYTTSGQLGSAGEYTLKEYVSNDDLILYEGSGVAAPRFGGSVFPRLCDGSLEYSTVIPP
eukprot:CAMPEP_0195290620 /NCGR_PEP_ID=MMETSP0707-20130614/6411_1 /TAXON_ID=33640 /ORGANISM="Asterionellopsis glacialis, Strain CCMP134" /LENGTH=850 /DNA_ID=CAMNT_0040350769 /DNA_START=1056 /DNA_END=3608 /DNA_ORIENTATION=+